MQSPEGSPKAKKSTSQEEYKTKDTFKKFFDNSTEAIFIHDLKGRFLEVNKTACERLHYTKEELLKKGPADIDSPAYKKNIPIKLKELIEKGETEFEGAHLTKEGEEILIDCKSKIIDYEGKKAVITIARDVTEKRKIKEQLERRIAREQLLLQLSKDYLQLKEEENIDAFIDQSLGKLGKLLEVCRTYLFKICEEEKTVSNTHEWCAKGITRQKKKLQQIPIDEELPRIYKELLEDNTLSIENVQDLGKNYLKEKKHLEEQGILSVIITPIKKEKKIIGFIGAETVKKQKVFYEDTKNFLRIFSEIIESIIEKDKTQQELKESNELINEINDALFLIEVDRKGRIQHEKTLPQLRKLLECKEENTRFVDYTEKLEKTYQEKLKRQLLELARGEIKSIEEQQQLIVKDKVKWVLLKAKAGKKTHKTTKLYGLLTDITENKKTEEKLNLKNEQIQAQTEELQTSNEELIKSEKILKNNLEFQTILSNISKELINATEKNFDEKIEKALKKLGEFFKVDRSYLFAFSKDLKYLSNTHEWCAKNVTAQKETLQNFPIKNIPWWFKKIRSGKVHIQSTTTLPESAKREKKEFRRQKIQSLLCISIYDEKNKLKGFVGFDAVKNQRTWRDEEINMLKLLAEMIGNTMNRIEKNKALAKSEEMLKDAQKIAKLGRWDYYHKENRLDWSETIHEIFETDPKTFKPTYEAFLKAIHPDDRKSVNDAWKQSLKKMTPYKIQHKILMSDGRIKWVDEECKTIFDKNKKPIHTTGIVQDITDRKHLEEEIRSKKEQFELAVKGSNDGIWDWNLQTNELFLSTKWKEQIGYKENELKNDFTSFENNIHEEDKKNVMAVVKKYLSGEIKTYDVEFRFKHKKGHYLWIRARAEAIRDEQGKPYRMAGSHTDITKQKLNELHLIESEEKFRQITENMGEVFWLRTPDNKKIIYVNPAYEKIWGRTTKSLYDNPDSFIESVYPDDLNIVLAEFEMYTKTGKFDLEYRILRPDGEIRWVHAKSFPVKDVKGNIINHTGRASDATQRKKIESELREKMEALARFKDATVDQIFELKEIEEENTQLKKTIDEMRIRKGTR